MRNIKRNGKEFGKHLTKIQHSRYCAANPAHYRLCLFPANFKKETIFDGTSIWYKMFEAPVFVPFASK